MWLSGSAKCFTISFISCACALCIAATSAAPRDSLQLNKANFTAFSSSAHFLGQCLVLRVWASVKWVGGGGGGVGGGGASVDLLAKASPSP